MRTSPVHTLRAKPLLLGTLVFSLIFAVGEARSDEVVKANNTNALNLTTSWGSGAVPGTNDVAVWNNTVTAANSTVLGANNLSFGGIKIVNPGGLVTIGTNSSGTNFSLGAYGIDMSAATRDLNITALIKLSASQTWNVATGRLIDSNNNRNNAGVNIDNQGFALTVLGAGDVDIGSLTGAGGIVKDGSGTLRLQSAGIWNYTGDVTVLNGTLRVGNQLGALGSGASALTFAGGKLEFVSNFNVAYGRNTTVSGNATIYNNNSGGNGTMIYTLGSLSIGDHELIVERNIQGTNTGSIIFGGVTLSGNATFNVGSNGTNAAAINQLQLGAIGDSGSGLGFIKTGTGELLLTNAGTFTGDTTVNNGIVRFAHGNAVQNSTVDMAGVGGSVQFATNVTSAVFGGLKGSQNLGLTNAANNAVALTVGGNNQTNTYSGVISGSGSLTKAGLGVFNLAGTNTYTGPTTVSAGTLVVDGAIAGDLTVDEGATLGGSGTIGGNTTVSGDLRPGNSPGLLTFDGNLTLTTSSRTVMEIGGTNRGVDYDAVNVGGALTYAGRLDLDFTSQAFAPNTTYTFNLFEAEDYQANFDSVHLVGVYGEEELAFDSINNIWSYSDGINNSWTFFVGEGKLELAVIPEPSTYALIVLAGLGFAGHVVRRRYRRR